MRKLILYLLFLAALATGAFWYNLNVKKEKPGELIMKNFKNKELTEKENFTENEDGQEAVGYIKKIYQKKEKNYIDVDYVELLSGKYALKAMIEDGKCMRNVKNKQALLKEIETANLAEPSGKFMECAPYDCYLRNRSFRIRTFEVSEKVKITRTTVFSDGIPGEKNITFEELKSGFTQEETHFRQLPFRLKMKDNIVIELKQQYLP